MCKNTNILNTTVLNFLSVTCTCKPLQEFTLHSRSLKYYNKYNTLVQISCIILHIYSAYSRMCLCFNHNLIKHPLILWHLKQTTAGTTHPSSPISQIKCQRRPQSGPKITPHRTGDTKITVSITRRLRNRVEGLARLPGTIKHTLKCCIRPQRASAFRTRRHRMYQKANCFSLSVAPYLALSEAHGPSGYDDHWSTFGREHASNYTLERIK